MIIGFSGYAGAGKDSAAKVLIAKGFEHRAFAGPLKELAILLNPMLEHGVSLAQWLTAHSMEETKRNSPELRRYLQKLGVGVREIVGEDAWVDAAFKDIDVSQDTVFTDVRFPNELDAIELSGGTVFRVERVGYGPINNHISETALDDYALPVIRNDGSLADLKETVLWALDGVRWL